MSRHPVVDPAVKPEESDLNLNRGSVNGVEFVLEIRIPLEVVLDKALPAMTKLIFGVLQSFCPARSNSCSPSVIELGKRAGVEAPNVIPHLGRLRKAKYIKIDRPGRRNRYTFLKSFGNWPRPSPPPDNSGAGQQGPSLTEITAG